MSQYLKSTDPDIDPCEITDAFEALYGRPSDAHYEHGQWFVWDSEHNVFWSVCDAEGDADWICNGYCFEELG